MTGSVKYSVIIPARNGARYLPACIASVQGQRFSSYELIVSNNFSSDGTDRYLATLVAEPHLRLVRPPHELSMVEHFEWVLGQANGEWLITLGVDDGLQPYFFSLAERLTFIAEKSGCRAIMSRRAYFFWPGCEEIYGQTAASFYARNVVSVVSTKSDVIDVLLGRKSYFDLPQCYTMGLFRADLLAEARARQGGKVFRSLTPDANFAAIACSLERRYVRCEIPLGWVGTSPNSNGFSHAIISRSSSVVAAPTDASSRSAADFEKLNQRSDLAYHFRAGDMSLGDGSILFWEALLQTGGLRGMLCNRIVNSRVVVTWILAGALLWRAQRYNSRGVEMLREIAHRNRVGSASLALTTWELSVYNGLARLVERLVAGVRHRVRRLMRRSQPEVVIEYTADRNKEPDLSLDHISMRVSTLVEENRLLDSII